MGQRLNIEIVEKGKCLANAYYHWSAYTTTSAELARQIIKHIPDVKEENNVLRAIRLLEVTGAKLMESEVEYAKTLGISNLKTATSRNDGLISISKNGIDETRKWQEHALYIYLDENRMNFQVLWNQKQWDWEKSQREDYDNKDAKASDLTVYDIDFTDVKFDKIDDFCKFIEEHYKEEFKTALDQWIVTNMIY